MTVTSRLPEAVQRNWRWQFDAACRDADTRIFFHPPGERGSEYAERDRAAKQICAGCPVRRPCLQFALTAREPYGVWGGLTEEERLTLTGPLQRPRRPAAVPVPVPVPRSVPSRPSAGVPG